MRFPVATTIELHPRYKTGRTLTKEGYVKLSMGGGKQRYEHRVVAEAMLGRPLSPREQVHHLNGDKGDNRPANLLVLGIREHALLHEEHHFAPIARWSRDHERCVACGTTRKPHMGRGLCRGCYSTASRHAGAAW